MEGAIIVLNINGSEAVYSDALGNTGSPEFEEIAAPLLEQVITSHGYVLRIGKNYTVLIV